MSISVGSAAYMNGAVLAPGAALTLDNSSTSVNTGQVVAQSLVMNGSGTLNTTSVVNEGSLSVGNAMLVQ
jgi:hypothetical protein